jgi:hypothetical protein
MDEWVAKTEGRRRHTALFRPDRPDTYVQIVEFPATRR